MLVVVLALAMAQPPHPVAPAAHPAARPAAQPPALKHQTLPQLRIATSTKPPAATPSPSPGQAPCPPSPGVVVIAPIVDVGFVDWYEPTGVAAPVLVLDGAVDVTADSLAGASVDAPFVLDVAGGVRYRIEPDALQFADRVVVDLPGGAVFRLDAWLGAARIAEGRALFIERDVDGAVFVTPL